ncbi:MAG: transcriptional regulator, IclR family [Peptococcaceae bacterium]|jgi:DNA-binding IclR family transcriptional regulator|nr:transcriptional regulator, IclR family [Peptococcaceae bacterium]
MHNNYLEVQSLQRAFDILEVIGNSSRPVNLKTLTEATGLAKSTVYRLLNNLEGRDYVRCNPDGTYQLGLKLLLMSQRVDQKFELKNLARPFLKKLNDLTRETVFLGILEKNKVLYVDMVESPHPVRLVAKIGTTNHVHCTSLGKALLMGHSEEAILDILNDQGMENRTEFTLVTPEAFLKEMELTRKRGYALDNRESEDECRCVGAPIYDHKGKVIAAVSISGPHSRFTLELIEKEVAEKLINITGQISNSLGLISK